MIEKRLGAFSNDDETTTTSPTTTRARARAPRAHGRLAPPVLGLDVMDCPQRHCKE